MRILSKYSENFWSYFKNLNQIAELYPEKVSSQNIYSEKPQESVLDPLAFFNYITVTFQVESNIV